MALIVQELSIEMVKEIKTLIEKISKRDRSLAQQLRRCASSVPLNIAEAAYSQGGNQTTRFHTAAGSASETRCALQVAEAWGYISTTDRQRVDAKLDRILAMLWGLTKRKPPSTTS